MMKKNHIESDSDWDSPTENNAGSPAHSDDGDSLPTDHSLQIHPKPAQRAPRIIMDSSDKDDNFSKRRDRDSITDMLAEAKVENYTVGETPPPHSFRDALQPDDSIADDVSVEVNIRQPRNHPKETRYQPDEVPHMSDKVSGSPQSSNPKNNRRKKKRISFDLSNNRSEPLPKASRPVEDSVYHVPPVYTIRPTDFDNYDSVPQVKMEPIAERAESGMRWIYREAMTALGLVLSVFMILLEELVRIIALKVFSPVLHMVRYFLMAIVQLALDITEFTVIGLKRIAVPLVEIFEVFVNRCCLPLIKAFRPINLSFISTAPLPHRVERDAYYDA